MNTIFTEVDSRVARLQETLKEYRAADRACGELVKGICHEDGTTNYEGLQAWEAKYDEECRQEVSVRRQLRDLAARLGIKLTMDNYTSTTTYERLLDALEGRINAAKRAVLELPYWSESYIKVADK